MHSLEKMKGIGKVNAEKLAGAGITTPEQLVELGSREALRRVRATTDPGACLSMLYGLECAVRGIPRGMLPEDVKSSLRAFYKTLE